MSIFFERIDVYDKKIQKVEYAPLFQKLLEAEKVTVSSDLLEDRTVNITTKLAHVFKVFEDFRFVQELREEIAKVKTSLVLAS